MSAIKSPPSSVPEAAVELGLAREGASLFRYLGVREADVALIGRYVAAVEAIEGKQASPITGLPRSPLLFRLYEPFGSSRTGFHRTFRARSAIAMALIETAPSTTRSLHPDGRRVATIAAAMGAVAIDFLVLPVRLLATMSGWPRGSSSSDTPMRP